MAHVLQEQPIRNGRVHTAHPTDPDTAPPFMAPSAPQLMEAAVLLGNENVRIQETPVPTPDGDQVRVRLEGCGVCASNIPLWEGREWFTYPLQPGESGHEGWGRIDAIGENVDQFVIGERVALLSNHAYAQYDVADADQVIRLPAYLADHPFPAEPLGCAVNVFHRSQIRAGETVAVVGVGFLGALLIQLSRAQGARVIAISRRPFALDVARRAGAEHAIPMNDHWDIIERVKELTDGHFCDRVIEATGKQWPLDLAAELTRERGRLIIAGYHQDGLRQVNMQLWNWRGLDVINAHERDPEIYLHGMQQALEAIQQQAIQPDSLLTHVYALNELGDALAATRDRPDGFLKALIQF